MYSEPIPGPVALGAWLDPRPGQEEGRGRHTGTCPLAEWLPRSSSPLRAVSLNATSSLHAHSEGYFGRVDPPHMALFEPSVLTQVQQHDPRDSGTRAMARPKPGKGRGVGPASGDVTPARMAAGVFKPDQACLQQCNQQHSRPLRRLIPGGWTPHTWPFSNLPW